MCTNCKGTGRQVFHGHFSSGVGTCGFCKGTGKKEDQDQWFKNTAKRVRA